MAQPQFDPSWATDADYPAGSDPWSATPTRVEPSAGFSAAGFAPNTIPAAQHLNYLFGTHAEHLAQLVDMFALQWRVARATPDLFNTDNDGDAPLIVSSYEVSGSIWIPTLLLFSSDPAYVYSSRDGDVWTLRGDYSATYGGSMGPPKLWVAGTYSSAPVVLAIGDGITGDWRKYTAVGGTQTFGGNTVGAGTAIQKGAQLWNGRWVLVGTGAAQYKNDLSAGNFTAATVPGGWAGKSCSCLAQSADREEAIALATASTTVYMYTLDGITWSAGAMPVSAAWTSATYHTGLGVWIVCSDAGLVYTSAAASGPWTLQPTAPTSIRDVIQFGRNVVAVIDNSAGAYGNSNAAGNVAISSDLLTWRMFTVGSSEDHDGVQNNYGWRKLLNHDGQIVAARSRNYNSQWNSAFAFSARAPWATPTF